MLKVALVNLLLLALWLLLWLLWLLLLLLLLLHHLLLHLLHLLHHLRVHIIHHVLLIVSAASSAHHLLHLLHLHHVLPHRWVHVHAAVHGHLRLHHGKVLLHPLEVLGHHLWCHATVVTHLLGHTSLGGLIVALLELVSLGGLFLFAKVASGLCSFNLNGLAMNLKGHTDAGFHACLAFEGHEPEPPWSPCVLVHHERGVNNSAELSKVISKFLVCRLLADTTNKDLAGLFLLVPRYSALRVNLSYYG